ncbi:hypothetical protein N9R04_04105 [Staphylococcus sp. SQ8-PEA]|uniref:Phage protein n=1 Tax=Staphylococcus marylandisciuri TaxID=2981529 RepID=A0ABT2QPK4_9STAP|nr:hypothetical protein [Staphylococcus marylandisciuri]MCU5745903.1 hypothetical protein [Staphylococcus marylandisciuri]
MFDYIYSTLEGYGFDVIDFKELNTHISYPFFVVRNVDITKTKYNMENFGGVLTATIDFWTYADDRGQHDSIVYLLDTKLSNIDSAEGYQLMIDNIDIKTLNDVENSDKQLLHTVFIATYKLF